MGVLEEYIQLAKKSGMNNQEIAAALTRAGWTMADLLDLQSDWEVEYKNSSSSSVKYAIEADDIVKSYGKLKALNGVSIRVPYGSVYALLGPNGAGKTTLVKILATLLNSDSGTSIIDGKDVAHNGDAVRSVVGLTGQFAAVDEALTGRENLELFGRLYHLPGSVLKQRAAELLEKFHLTDSADRVVKTYSGGMRRRLDIAASLMNTPKILFLDEPTTGLDPQSRLALWEIIKELVAGGTTVLLTTQYLEEADHLADRVAVVDHGRIVAEGTSKELKNKIGNDFIEIHLQNSHQTGEAMVLLRSMFGVEPEEQSAGIGIITLPSKRGPIDLVEALRALDRARIGIADIALRQPTLDDVFLSLTGHAPVSA